MAHDKKNTGPEAETPTEVPAPGGPGSDPVLTAEEAAILEHEGRAVLFEMGESVPDPPEPFVGAPDMAEPVVADPTPAPSGKVVDFAAAREEAGKDKAPKQKASKQKTTAPKNKAAAKAGKGRPQGGPRQGQATHARQNVPKAPDGRVLKPSGLFLMAGIDGLHSLPRHSVDMLLTDPPYSTTRNYWDVLLIEFWEAVRWAVKPDGAVLLFAQCPYDKVLGASNLAMLRYEWIWYKERGTGFLNANRAALKKSENILVFYQKPLIYNPQFACGEPYRKTHTWSGSNPNYGKFERVGTESSDGRRYPSNVLFVPTVSGSIYATQKPVELCEYFIKTYTNEGAVVADICAGSGTTAVAALNMGRRFICFENAPAFYGQATERIEQARLAVARGEKGV